MFSLRREPSKKGPSRSGRLHDGEWPKLYQCACEMDLEGIVSKHTASPYQDRLSSTSWIKITNPEYRAGSAHVCRVERALAMVTCGNPNEQLQVLLGNGGSHGLR
jgi:hypothetical protein